MSGLCCLPSHQHPCPASSHRENLDEVSKRILGGTSFGFPEIWSLPSRAWWLWSASREELCLLAAPSKPRFQKLQEAQEQPLFLSKFQQCLFLTVWSDLLLDPPLHNPWLHSWALMKAVVLPVSHACSSVKSIITSRVNWRWDHFSVSHSWSLGERTSLIL